MLSYGSDETANVDRDAVERGLALGLRPLNVICDEPGAKVGDSTSVSFVVFVEYLPRPGDRLELEDGNVCEVQRVYHKLTRVADENVPCLVPNVFEQARNPEITVAARAGR